MPSFAEHKKKWIDCKLCPLSERRTHVVLLRGRIPCNVLFVGEAPGAGEDATGRPFIGPAGRLLDRIIEESLEGKYSYALTNLVGCIPIGEEGSKTAEPPVEAIVKCAPRLIEITKMCRPSLVVLVGKLSEKHFPLSGYRTTCIIHPAAILRMDVSQQGLAIQRTIVQIRNAVEID